MIFLSLQLRLWCDDFVNCVKFIFQFKLKKDFNKSLNRASKNTLAKLLKSFYKKNQKFSKSFIFSLFFLKFFNGTKSDIIHKRNIIKSPWKGSSLKKFHAFSQLFIFKMSLENNENLKC